MQEAVSLELRRHFTRRKPQVESQGEPGTLVIDMMITRRRGRNHHVPNDGPAKAGHYLTVRLKPDPTTEIGQNRTPPAMRTWLSGV